MRNGELVQASLSKTWPFSMASLFVLQQSGEVNLRRRKKRKMRERIESSVGISILLFVPKLQTISLVIAIKIQGNRTSSRGFVPLNPYGDDFG